MKKLNLVGKVLTSAALAVGLTGAATAGALYPPLPPNLEFDGSFGEVSATGAGCDAVFATSDYRARHALSGPTWRTSVLQLSTETDGAFWDNVAFVGLLGGSNDLYYEKTLRKDGRIYDVLAEGFVDRSVVYLEFTVKAAASDGVPACEATATFSGFN